VAIIAASMVLPGCITLKADHDELVGEVAKLRNEVKSQSDTIARADALADKLDEKLAEVEDVLRRNQADLGLRVQNLEVDVQELRGAAESADFMATAASQELTELRAELDGRLKLLEEKLNEATNIPESKEDLWVEAGRQSKGGKHAAARRLYRTFVSRYPDDSRVPEAKFNIGLTYFSERDYKAALGEFYKVIQESPKAGILPDALYYSGLAFAKLGQCESAIAYFDALRQKKTNAPAQYKKKALEQMAILKKDAGDICLDKKR
jgi:TolA-binding protein